MSPAITVSGYRLDFLPSVGRAGCDFLYSAKIYARVPSLCTSKPNFPLPPGVTFFGSTKVLRTLG